MDNSWCFSTNWMISGASRPTAVNFVSSPDSQIDSDESTTTGRRAPLILKSSSSDNSSPCDIKICFTQRHKIKKIYVRSTARTYEVHYTRSLESTDVYLCTVGCDMASREEDLLPSSDNKENREAIFGNSKVSNEETASESDIHSTKDEWEVVGIPATPPEQDFYEAAIDTNDAEPCASVTLRLLSPHSKVLIHIDEVRVFADALESSDPETKTSNISQSPFVPCLQDEYSSSVVDEPSESQSQAQASDKKEKHYFACDHVENVLEQLLLKVCKIEDTLKPIINMEARLQRVENYMELLAKNSKGPASLMTESKSSGTADDTSKSSGGSQFVPGLMVTAPVFSFDEYENKEDICHSEPRKVFSQGHEKKTSSVVDVLDTFSSFNIQSPDSPLMFSHPSSLQPVPVTREIDGEEFGQPAEIRQQALESVLGGFGQARQLGTGFPKSAAKPTITVGSGFSSYMSNGFSKTTAQGGNFASQASAAKGCLGPDFSSSKLSTFPTAASGNGFTRAATSTFDGQLATFGRGFTDRVTSFGSPKSASAGGFTDHATSFGSPKSASGGGFTDLATSFGFPKSASGGGFTDRATSFGSPKSASGVGFTDRATSFGSPKSASGVGFTDRATSIDSPKSVSGVGFTDRATSFGVPATASGLAVPTTASGGGFASRATSFGVIGTSSGGEFTARETNSNVPVTASGGGFSASATSFGVPATASGGGFTKHKKLHADKQHRNVDFQVGDFVWAVLTKDRFPAHEYSKLAARKIGPVEIVEKINSNAYRLQLSSHVRTSDVFNVHHLIPFSGDNSSSDSDDDTSDSDDDAMQLGLDFMTRRDLSKNA